MPSRVIQAIAGETWAIRPEALESILAIAAREHDYADNLEALEQKLGRPLLNTERATVRDGVAVVPVSGPLFRRANLFVQVSGATSYDMLATDLRAAVDNPDVKAILLNIDSPGGAASGVNELSKQVRAIRGVKPVIAYIGGQGASAAYWLASAADQIVAEDSAMIGSVGAMIGVTVSGDRSGERSYTFVSSQSPLKNADPGTAEGARELQRLTDEMAQVFIDTVAENRGVTADDVLAQYGQGAVFTGVEAIKRGMVDELGTFESVMQRLAQGDAAASTSRAAARSTQSSKTKPGASAGNPKPEEENMDLEKLKAEHPDLYAQVLEEGKAQGRAEGEKAGAEAERQRIQAIEELGMDGHAELLTKAKFAEPMTAEAVAMEIVKAEKAKRGQYLANRQADAAALDDLDNPPPADPDAEAQEEAELEAVAKIGAKAFNARKGHKDQ